MRVILPNPFEIGSRRLPVIMPFMQYCLLVRGIWHNLFLFLRLKTLNNKYKQTNKQTRRTSWKDFLALFQCLYPSTWHCNLLSRRNGTETRFLRHSMAQIRVVTFTQVLLKRNFWKDLTQPGWHTMGKWKGRASLCLRSPHSPTTYFTFLVPS